MSHQGVQYYYTMPAHDIGETWLDKLQRFFRLGNPVPKKGRKYIDPSKPYGHWAAGWEER